MNLKEKIDLLRNTNVGDKVEIECMKNNKIVEGQVYRISPHVIEIAKPGKDIIDIKWAWELYEIELSKIVRYEIKEKLKLS